MLFSVQYNTGPGEQFEVYDDCLVFDIYCIRINKIESRDKKFTHFFEIAFVVSCCQFKVTIKNITVDTVL